VIELKKVLIVDDDQITRRLIAHHVNQMGHCSIQSSNGRVALTTLMDNPDIQLLITDVMMPELDGPSLVAKLRAQTRFDDLKIIMISGIAKPNEIADLLDQGVSLFMPKPLNIEDLRRNIHHCMRPKRVTQPDQQESNALPAGEKRDAHFRKIGERLQARLMSSR
jgi:DNA-binding response OmpR family regulator